MTVVFASLRTLDRAENIKTLYYAYDGDKKFVRRDYYNNDELRDTLYDLVVTDEFLPDCISPMIMIYHGIAGGKTYGLDAPRKYHTEESLKNYRYFITSSDNMVEFAAKQSGSPVEKVLPLGMPRTDVYIGAKKGDGGTPYADKKVYLYAPTFNTLTTNLTNWKVIDGWLEDDEVFLIKRHQINRNLPSVLGNKFFKHIVEIDPYVPSTPYLLDCDVLITDFSSIMFDAMVLEKPVVLFEKDWGTYKERRGMYYEYPDEYSGRHATAGYKMLQLCREAVVNGPTDIELMNRKRFAGACDGHAVERIIDLIKKEVNHGE